MDINEKYIVMLGCFDTKAEDFSYLLRRIKDIGAQVVTIDTGVMDSEADFTLDFDNHSVAEASGTSIEDIRKSNDRGKAVELMGKGAAVILSNLVAQNKVKGVIGMGGGGGTYITLEAIQGVPMGIPKLCLSTLAAKDLSRQIGVKDVTLMVASVDIAGLNSISTLLMDQAAAAVCAMAALGGKEVETKGENAGQEGARTLPGANKRIAISMFGNTTKCVEKCSELLKAKGYEPIVFHATGTGGATMESLIREGLFDAVLDVTTTELADELCGGVLSAGPDRLTAAAEMGIPQVVVPGCLDMVNFSQKATVPEKYRSRQLFNWSPDVTLMRTNETENRELGKILADKLNGSKAVVEVILPLKGISQIDSEGDIFYRPEIDAALFAAIKENLYDTITATELDAHINDEPFAIALVERLLKLME